MDFQVCLRSIAFPTPRSWQIGGIRSGGRLQPSIQSVLLPEILLRTEYTKILLRRGLAAAEGGKSILQKTHPVCILRSTCTVCLYASRRENQIKSQV